MEIKTEGQKLYEIYHLIAKVHQTPQLSLLPEIGQQLWEYGQLNEMNQQLWESIAKRYKEQIYREVISKINGR